MDFSSLVYIYKITFSLVILTWSLGHEVYDHHMVRYSMTLIKSAKDGEMSRLEGVSVMAAFQRTGHQVTKVDVGW